MEEGAAHGDLAEEDPQVEDEVKGGLVRNPVGGAVSVIRATLPQTYAAEEEEEVKEDAEEEGAASLRSFRHFTRSHNGEIVRQNGDAAYCLDAVNLLPEGCNLLSSTEECLRVKWVSGGGRS
ncbi:hypothetical protein Baya_5936 [Bagarius yarrelli]|uniref:Uncharacterized protein n=1 Tax=Bagarius yarrelli TaxID=175774 RepID=A0A556U0N0_BAGYA|nr:hypothetical protein Baya_5936 [Bagarius yarrelli]